LTFLNQRLHQPLNAVPLSLLPGLHLFICMQVALRTWQQHVLLLLVTPGRCAMVHTAAAYAQQQQTQQHSQQHHQQQWVQAMVGVD
jgi:hypothetical protein